jgi:Asp-tRNA(Asn)/Glu-tRNA(Gln) amidotransferase A subunit family amidase
MGRCRAKASVATVIWNICEATVGVLPVTRVDKHIDAVPDSYLQKSTESWVLEKRLYGGTDPAYNVVKMHNLAVGVQVVGRCWEEEKVLKVMEVVEKAVNFA